MQVQVNDPSVFPLLAELASSNGSLFYDFRTGLVNKSLSFHDEGFDEGEDAEGPGVRPRPYPYRVDVDEWHKRYPGEKLDGTTHDILDFGIWFDDGQYERYDPPCESWRLEREEMIKNGRLYHE